MKINLIILAAFTGVLALHGKAQSDPSYRQNQFNALILNPAQSGANERNQVTVDALKSWVGVEGAPKTITASGNFNLTNQLGLGFFAVNDEIGPVKTNRINLSAAYHLKLSKNWVASLGLSGMLSNVVVDLPSVATTVLNDPHMQTILNSGTQLHAGYGLLVYRKDFYFGFSQPIIGKVNFSNVMMDQYIQSNSFVSYVGGKINLKNNWQFRPNLLYRYVNTFYPYLDLTTMFTYDDRIDLGASYQLNGSFGALIGIEINKTLYLGYSYSYPTTSLNRASTQTHEVSLRVSFGKSKNSFGFQNPRFFN